MKRLITTFLALFVLAINANNANAQVKGMLTPTISWELRNDGTLIIEGEGEMPDLERNEYPWVKKYKKITSVIIGEGIEHVGDNSFSNFCEYKKRYNISSVTFNNSLFLSIGEYAFYGNNISSLTLVESTYVHQHAFSLNGMETLSITAGNVYGFSTGSFAHNHISELTFPEVFSITVGKQAFLKCGIKKLVLPSALTDIGSEAFAENQIENLKIPEGVEEIGEKAFFDCGIKNLSLPTTLKEIGVQAFSNNSITTVDIPEGVKNVGEKAFEFCAIENLYIPSTLTEIGESAFFCNTISSLTIPEGVTKIGGFAFSVCNINKLHLPSSLKEVGEKAFYITALSELVVPEGVEKIGLQAFADGKIKSISLPSTLEEIGDKAFISDVESNTLFDGEIINLPTMITEKNCEKYGIAKEAYKRSYPTSKDLYDKGQVFYDKEEYEAALQCYLQGATARIGEDSDYRDLCCIMASYCYRWLGDTDNQIAILKQGYEATGDFFCALRLLEIFSPVYCYTGNGGFWENTHYDKKYTQDRVSREHWEVECISSVFDIKSEDIQKEQRIGLYQLFRNKCIFEGEYENALIWAKNAYELSNDCEDIYYIPKYLEGKKEYKNAIKYYMSAYEIVGDENAIKNIVDLYKSINNYTDAATWQSKLASTGDKDAQYELGQIYKKLSNKNLSIFWYKKAAEQGHLQAEEALAHQGIYLNTQQATSSQSTSSGQYHATHEQSHSKESHNHSSTAEVYTPEYGWRDVWVNCYHCHGTGQCSACGGTGYIVSTRGDGSYNSTSKCPVCYGNRTCTICGGMRGHYEKQQYQIR